MWQKSSDEEEKKEEKKKRKREGGIAGIYTHGQPRDLLKTCSKLAQTCSNLLREIFVPRQDRRAENSGEFLAAAQENRE